MLTFILSPTVVASPTSAAGEIQKKFWLSFSPSKRRLPPNTRQVNLEYTVTDLNSAGLMGEEEGVRIELLE